MDPGTIALVRFPFTATASEPFKRRPVLVLSALGFGPDRAIGCVMITSNAQRCAKPGPGDVLIADWKSAGLLLPSVVRGRRIWTAEDRDFVRRLGTLDTHTLEAVRAQARLTLAL